VEVRWQDAIVGTGSGPVFDVSSVRNVENAFTASGQPLLALARSERPEEF